MATDTTLFEALASFTTATDVAAQALSASDSILPPGNGISLLDTKNEIFLSYLQALALRNLQVIRRLTSGADLKTTQRLSNEMTKRLVEHRVYLERGIRPLEQKIKFQVDRVVKAADDEERISRQKSKHVALTGRRSKKATNGGEDLNETGSEDDDSDPGSDDEDPSSEEDIDQSAFRPNLSAMTSRNFKHAELQSEKEKADTVYRPPRISATVMPTTDRREREERKPNRSKTLDEFVSSEYSTAPVAEPSIGSNIAAGGRSNKSHRQLRDEQERRDFEETNLVRLPKQSKKELARKGYSREKDGGFGGEDWRSLGASLDRITDLTRGKAKERALDKSRKRSVTEDGPRRDGSGAAFDIKKRRLEKKSGR